MVRNKRNRPSGHQTVESQFEWLSVKPQLRRIVGAYAAYYNESIDTTRSRVSFFMNKFRRLGFADYDGSGLEVHSSLLDVVLHG